MVGLVTLLNAWAAPPPPTATAVVADATAQTALPLAVWGALVLLGLIFAGAWWGGRSARRK